MSVSTELDDLVARATALIRPDRARSVLGLTGPPGSGKSTLARALADRLGDAAAVVPMDGFHLADSELSRLGLSGRKGAPETFDVDGYLSLLERLRRDGDDTVYAPWFDRGRELAVAGAIAVEPRHRLVITEGNYLLLDAPRWRDVRPLLAEVWYVDVDDRVRTEHLVERHVRHGRSREAARVWVATNDEPNAEVVRAARHRADLAVAVAWAQGSDDRRRCEVRTP
jgi:pantothenate kinase